MTESGLAVITETADYNVLYSKSNSQIMSKMGKNTMLTLKLFSCCYAQMSSNKYQLDNGHIVCQFRVPELRDIFGVSSKNFYESLRTACLHMSNKKIINFNDVQKSFRIHNLITDAVCENGLVTIRFNDKLSDQLINVSAKFTKFRLGIMTSFDSTYSYYIYEALRSRAYTPKGEEKKQEYVIDYNLAELKFDLGIYDASESREAQKIIQQSPNPDWEKVIEVLNSAPKAKKPSLDRWVDLKAKCIDVAVEEINKKTDIEIYDIKPQRSGRGGKIRSLKFFLRYKTIDGSTTATKAVDEPSVESVDVVEEIYAIISPLGLKLKDAMLLASDAAYDADRVRKAVEILKDSKTEIQSVTGFLRSAIKEGYQKSEKYAKQTSFNNFEERNTDWNKVAESFIN